MYEEKKLKSKNKELKLTIYLYRDCKFKNKLMMIKDVCW